jgi:hypothetical protein
MAASQDRGLGSAGEARQLGATSAAASSTRPSTRKEHCDTIARARAGIDRALPGEDAASDDHRIAGAQRALLGQHDDTVAFTALQIEDDAIGDACRLHAIEY